MGNTNKITLSTFYLAAKSGGYDPVHGSDVGCPPEDVHLTGVHLDASLLFDVISVFLFINILETGNCATTSSRVTTISNEEIFSGNSEANALELLEKMVFSLYYAYSDVCNNLKSPTI